ncbi:iron ABC transporter permease [Pistricoccus aurantiacus]|uniref:Iron ABC transporter permease n=2 Tax=Pistricoccus aurantiacus TaxID=1883414 RepID=A0A5B8SVK3_9GAMM|nr:iron ABC transporter permease [Pistricoccus aurantiacus]
MTRWSNRLFWIALGPGLLLLAAVGWWSFREDDTAAESFAGLGETQEGFPQARPGTELRFPEDHGAHPDYRIEWWYLTANLRDAQGNPLGMQWTLFRQALAPPDANSAPVSPWQTRQLWMAHAALSKGDTHLVAERFARGDTGQAGVKLAPFRAWLDNWQLTSRVDDSQADAFSDMTLSVQAQDSDGEDFGYRLQLKAQGPLVAHGEAGFSQKSADGQGSFYYSQPFYRVEGEVTLNGENLPVSGQAWLDREWSSQLLGPTQSGWDWFSLHLKDGHRLMAFRLRGGGKDKDSAYVSGSWITPQGELTPLKNDEVTLTPLETRQVAGREVPTRWRLALPDQAREFIVTARNPNRWMGTSFPYWEGAVTVRNSGDGALAGEGYLEMTGY